VDLPPFVHIAVMVNPSITAATRIEDATVGKIARYLQRWPAVSEFWLLLQSTGATIQVANEMLPGSTERAVTISGSPDVIAPCIQRLCAIAIEVFHCMLHVLLVICWHFSH